MNVNPYPGFFIVLEGTDGSGKATQSKLLEEYLLKQGLKVKTDDYPHYYTSPWGELIGRFQMGEFGDPSKISPYFSCLPYMIDEYFGGLRIKKWVKQGYFVLSNRYFTSNVHQVGKLSGRARGKFRRWLWKIGWEKMGIYRPHLIIVLFVPPAISMKLSLRKNLRGYTKGRKRDLVERDRRYQTGAAREYLRMCQDEDNWVLLRCCDRQGKLRTPQEIQVKILKILKDREII